MRFPFHPQTICIALGIEQATLRHRGDKGIAWLTQLMDVIDVIDYPVLGYTPSTVLSELHVHVFDCAVDYRYVFFYQISIEKLKKNIQGRLYHTECNHRREKNVIRCCHQTIFVDLLSTVPVLNCHVCL